MDIKKEIWVNQETGEVIETDSITKDIKRNNFMITYMTYLIDVVEILGTKKMMVFKYILENMDKGNNTLIITTRELAEETKISRQVIIDTLKLLEERGLIGVPPTFPTKPTLRHKMDKKLNFLPTLSIFIVY